MPKRSRAKPGTKNSLDLFVAAPRPPDRVPDAPQPSRDDVASLSDDDLLAGVAAAGLADSLDYAREIGRRCLAAGIPVLESLCARHAGYGRTRVVAEQAAAIEAMVAIGGGAASAALGRLLGRGLVRGPGLRQALSAASTLRAAVPQEVLGSLLGSDDPEVRRLAADCVLAGPRLALRLAPGLVDLLDDLHEPIQIAAACALARLGRREGRAVLLRALRDEPSSPAIEAAAAIAGDEIVVLLKRLVTGMPDLASAAREALAGLEAEPAGG